MHRGLFLLLFLFISSLFGSITDVKIAVLAFKSKNETLKEWLPTQNYLNREIKDFNFIIIPMDYPEINQAVKTQNVDFVITNSGHYVYLEVISNISRIATMTKYKNGHWLDSFGGVMFTLSNRDDIKTIDDLKGKKIAAVDKESLGGFVAQMYELQKKGIDADDISIDFTGMPHGNVVQKVLSGSDDVGFVRTEVLEDMVKIKKLDLKSIKILNSQKPVDFPFILSTTLYPEWPLARMPKTSYALANKVIIALFRMNDDLSSKPTESDIMWTAPLEYRTIHDAFAALHLPPYDKTIFTLWDVFNKYKLLISILLTVAFFIFIGIIREFYLRRKLLTLYKDLSVSNENLQYQSLKNEMLLRLSGDGIHILDINGNITQVSDTFCKMLGYLREEMIGMNLLQWDMTMISDKLQKEIKSLTEETKIYQTKHQRKDGTLYDCEVTIAKIYIFNEEYIYCSARDITERLNAEAQTKLAAMVFETSSDAISITDADSKTISVNEAFVKLTGYSNDEVKGHDIAILQSSQHNQKFYVEMWESIIATGKWAGTVTDRRKDGSLFTKWLEIMTIFDEDNKPYRRIGKLSELTDGKEAQEKIWHQANFDTLTDLPNRSMFMFELEKRLSDIEHMDTQVALMYLDLDNFKEINESMGHENGDILLIESAKRVVNCAGENAIVSRIGGDEYTIIFPRLDEIDLIEKVAQSLLEELSKPFRIGEKDIYISVSIGITIAPEDASKADNLLKNAEQAMYEAKQNGRNRYRYFTSSMQETIVHKMALIDEMRKAIELNQFVLYYQPIMQLSTGEVHKAEALIRWKKPDGQMISPADFIPLSEETGMILDIGEFVIREACQRVKSWRALYDKTFQISINKSPKQFTSERYSSSFVVDVLKDLGLSSDSIVVEITEGLLMEKTQIVKDKFLMYEKEGVLLSLDDFGTGYSSLSYLKKFDIDFLKIDQSFVRNLESDENDRILCEAIVVMAHKLGIKVIAEGVESMKQRDILSLIGCDYIQGYLISRPIEAEEFEKRFLL